MKPFEEYLTGTLTVNGLINLLKWQPWKANDNFNAPVYSRWGDGEFSAIFGEDGQNCDGHKYFESLGKELRLALRRQSFYGNEYYYALVPIAVKVFGDRIQEHVDGLSEANKPDWVSGNLLMEANREGKLGEFFSVLRKRYRILYVGPRRLRPLHGDQFLNIGAWVEVPEKNAWLEYEQIIKSIIFKFLYHRCEFIGFSAGMPTKVLMSDLKIMFRNRIEIPMIDFGSMWDGYYGFNSRKYHSDFDWGEIRRMNLE